MSTRDDYIAKMKTQLDAWNAEIDALEDKASDVRADVKVKYDEQLAALRVKRQEGEKKLDEMQEASETAWEQIKTESENVWAAFKDSVEAFQQHFKT
jgi:predicted  nucleic acid-binding Zn-ribbon protein